VKTVKTWRYCCGVLTLLVTLAATAFAGDATVEGRLEELESGLAGLRQEVADLRLLLERLLEQDAQGSLAAKVSALEATSQELVSGQEELAETVRSNSSVARSLSDADIRRPQLTVYGTFTATAPEGEDSVFDATSFELVLSGRPHTRLGFFAEVEFEQAAAVGGGRGGEIKMEQAYASYTISPLMNLRAGVLLVPFGNVNVDHYAPNRDVISKPLVSYAVAPSDWTDNGLGFYGNALVGDAWSFDYEAYVIAGLDADISALGLRAARQGFGVDNNDDKAVAARIAWNRAGWLEMGWSGYRGKFDDEDRLRMTGWALDAFFERGRLRMTGEYNHVGAEQPSGPDAVFEGYYARLVLDVTPPALHRGGHGRDFPSSRLDLVAQYDDVRITGPLGGTLVTNKERRYTLGLNYRPSHHWVLKLNYERSEASAAALQKGDFRGILTSIGFLF